jgi:hypothetical protein
MLTGVSCCVVLIDVSSCVMLTCVACCADWCIVLCRAVLQVCLQKAGFSSGDDEMRWWQFGSSTLDALKTFQVGGGCVCVCGWGPVCVCGGGGSCVRVKRGS